MSIANPEWIAIFAGLAVFLVVLAAVRLPEARREREHAVQRWQDELRARGA